MSVKVTRRNPKAIPNLIKRIEKEIAEIKRMSIIEGSSLKRTT